MSEKPGPSTASKEGAPTEKDLELSYEKHRSYAAAAFEEYEKHYKELMQHMDPKHLDSVAEILRKKENTELQREALIESMRQAVHGRLQAAMAKFWQDSNVENGLISLEVLKEKYKEYEGTNWNIAKKTPADRTLVMRMHFKQMCKKHLTKQLQYQEGLLKKAMEENVKYRTQIQEVSQERVYLRDHIERTRKVLSEATNDMKQMQEQIIATQEL